MQVRAASARGAGEASRQEQRQAQQETAHEPGVHPGQQGVVAQVVEVRDPALARLQVFDRRIEIGWPDTMPAQAHGGLDVEVGRVQQFEQEQLEARAAGFDCGAVRQLVDGGVGVTAKAFNWARGLLSSKPKPETTSATTTGGDVRSGEPVEVYLAANDLEAQVIKSFLESNDIPVMTRTEAISIVYGMTVGPLAEVSILVPEPLAPRAVELLEAQAEEAAAAEEAQASGAEEQDGEQT